MRLLCQCDCTVAGENALSPCISVRTAITIDSHTTAGGQLQHCLAVPRLAVATALMELPPDIRSMVSRFEGGVLMGALGFQATLTLPIVASGMLTAAVRSVVCLSFPTKTELQSQFCLVIIWHVDCGWHIHSPDILEQQLSISRHQTHFQLLLLPHLLSCILHAAINLQAASLQLKMGHISSWRSTHLTHSNSLKRQC